MNSQPRWTPHVTVATVIEREDRYLLVHEAPPPGKSVYNQPAGHLEINESLSAAAQRETLEETGWNVEITHYLGVYRFIANNGITYMRHGFVGKALNFDSTATLDSGIIEAVWMSYEDILTHREQMRSPMVLSLINDYRAGLLYPLALLHEEG